MEPNVPGSYGGLLMHRCNLKLLDGQTNLPNAIDLILRCELSHLINGHRTAPRSFSRLCRDALRLRKTDEVIKKDDS